MPTSDMERDRRLVQFKFLETHTGTAAIFENKAMDSTRTGNTAHSSTRNGQERNTTISYRVQTPDEWDREFKAKNREKSIPD